MTLISSMDIGAGKTALIPIPKDVADYFGISTADTNTAIEPVKRTRESHKRVIIKKLNGSGAENEREITVAKAEWEAIPALAGGRGVGQAITVPTELKTPERIGDNGKKVGGNIRTVTLRVPRRATRYAIANWIKKEFTTKRPDYYITESGRRYPTNVGTATDVNPGNADATP